MSFLGYLIQAKPPLNLGKMVRLTLNRVYFLYTAIAVRIRAFDCTLVGKHVCSREGVLGSNPTTPKLLPKVFAAR